MTAAVAHTEMRRTEVGVQERGLEAHEGLGLAEEPHGLGALIRAEQGKHEPFELRALVLVRVDPVGTLHRKPRRVEPVERLEEGTDATGVLSTSGSPRIKR